jgi:hypothetical protein
MAGQSYLNALPMEQFVQLFLSPVSSNGPATRPAP